MIELPEATVLSKEIDEALTNKIIKSVTAGQNPHKFAWYHKEPERYQNLMAGKAIKKAYNLGGFVRINIGEDVVLLLSEGIRIRYIPEGEPVRQKHQLLLEFTDHSSLVCSVQMYGGLVAFHDGDYDNDYYGAARNKPSPLSDLFNEKYFTHLRDNVPDTLSLKAFLATEQRIPGVGNGVIQDILFNAKLHPRKKVSSLEESDFGRLFGSVKSTLADMVAKGGRDTEQDIFGYAGGYQSILSKNTVGKPCPRCGSVIEKQAYMGGSIYFCAGCQEQ
jgi:formamidopyrimidine-DNA glycosylase